MLQCLSYGGFYEKAPNPTTRADSIVESMACIVMCLKDTSMVLVLCVMDYTMYYM